MGSVELDVRAVPRRLRGYDPAAVEGIVRELVAARTDAESESSRLRERIAALRRALERDLALERELREVFVEATREAETMRAEAEREARRIAESARASDKELERQLSEEAGTIRSRIDGMRNLEDEVRASARLLVLEALHRLDTQTGPPEEAPREQARTTTEALPGRPETERRAPDEAPPPTAPEQPVPEAAPPGEPSIEDTIDVPLPAFEGEPVVAPKPEARPRFAGLRSVALSLAILAVGAGVGVAVWLLQSSPETPARSESTPAESTQAAGGPAADGLQSEVPVEAAEASPETAPTPSGSDSIAVASTESTDLVLRLQAARGDCWLQVRAGSAGGKLLFEGFLFEGEARRFEARRLWLRVGNPGNLDATLDGKRLRDLPSGTADVLVTAQGVKTLSVE